MAPAETEILKDLIGRYAGSAEMSPAVRAQLEHIARGEAARQVASSTGVSYEAVRCRRARLFRSLGVTSSAEILAGLLGLVLEELARSEAGPRVAA